jgi:NAD(P)H-hydrate epimerase
LVLDADALNTLSQGEGFPEQKPGRQVAITPHPTEFGRLVGRPTEEVLSGKVKLAREFATRHGIWVVFKDFRTLIADPSGSVYVCPYGNPGMATAGMGDVLTGLITSLAGRYRSRGLTSDEDFGMAVQAGVLIHALAGDAASSAVGQESLTAGSVIELLGQTLSSLLASDVSV